jgi:predicted phage terminase large subunit-like protein
MTNLQLSPQEAANLLIERRQANESLIDFTRYTMPNFEFNWHHRLICEALERVERGECKRLIIEAPPRHTKSELASRRFPAWFIGRNPDKQIITATYNGDFASDFGRDVRNIVDSQRYEHVFNVSLRNDSKAANRWHTNKGGIYVAAGVGTGLTGRGAHVALIDDPFKDREEADSELRREKVWNWYRSVLLTRLMPDAAIIVIATRWHEEDLTGKILAKAEETGEQWEVLKFPAIKEDKALWPEWYDIDYLTNLKNTIGKREWNSLYQQNPTPDDGTLFKRHWFLNSYTKLPSELNYYITADYAVSEKQDADYTCIGVWGVDSSGICYLVDWWIGKQTHAVYIEQLLVFIKYYKPSFHQAEQGVIRQAIEPILRRRMREDSTYTRLKWSSSTGDKVAKCRSFQALAENGVIRFPLDFKDGELILDQLIKFPAGKHDDCVDMCSEFGRAIMKVWDATEPTKPEPKPDPNHVDGGIVMNMQERQVEKQW